MCGVTQNCFAFSPLSLWERVLLVNNPDHLCIDNHRNDCE